jgi:pyruvoyl-dependent arginine decarboxylase (PvlArgDC)
MAATREAGTSPPGMVLRVVVSHSATDHKSTTAAARVWVITVARDDGGDLT